MTKNKPKYGSNAYYDKWRDVAPESRTKDLIDLVKYPTFALPHNLASSFKPKDGAILIRVLDAHTKYQPLIHKDRYQKIIEVQFNDVDLDIEESYIQTMTRPQIVKALNLFNYQKARDILFALDGVTTSQIVVHCHAGISRSVAIALFLSRYYFKNEDNYKAILACNWYLHGGNRYVYHTLQKQYKTLTRNNWIHY